MNDNTSVIAYEGDLTFFRRLAPVNGNHWARRECLTVFEAVLLYYEIEPTGSHGISECEFELQMRTVDEDRIYELICDSFHNGNLEIHEVHFVE